MPKRTHLVALLALFVSAAVAAPAAAQEVDPEKLTAQQIVDKALDFNTMGFQSGQAQVTLQVENKGGDAKTRSLDLKSKKVDGKLRTLVTLTAPKDVRGQAFLFAEQKADDDVWMYLPAFKIVRRIEGGQKEGSFLGSHFTYADLESRDTKKASYKRLKDEKIGTNEVYVVEGTPEAGSDSDYSRIVIYIRKSDFIPLKTKFFKVEEVSRTIFVEKLDKTESGETYVKQMTLRPSGGGYTRMVLEAFDETELPDAIFAKDRLGK